MCQCDSAWILQPWYHIDAIMRCIKYDVAEGLGVKCTATTGRYCDSAHKLSDVNQTQISTRQRDGAVGVRVDGWHKSGRTQEPMSLTRQT